MAERSENHRLYINKPCSENRHHHNLNAEELPQWLIAESGEKSEGKSDEISDSAKSGKWDPTDLGVRACQNRLAARDNAARYRNGGEMMDREINRVTQTHKRNESRSKRQPRHCS